MNNSTIKVISITSGKGGVGKTNVSVNLAYALAKLGKKSMILDADFGLGNADLLLGVTPTYNLADVFAGKRDMKDIILDCNQAQPNYIQLIPAASGMKDMANLKPAEYNGIINAFNDLEVQSDYFIVDTAAGISDEIASFCRASQQVIVVMCNEPTSINDSYALMKVFSNEYAITDFKIVLNQVNQNQAKQVFSQFEKVCSRHLKVNLELIGSLSESDELKYAVKTKKAVVQSHPNSVISHEFLELASNIDNLKYDFQINGYVQFFLNKLLVT